MRGPAPSLGDAAPAGGSRSDAVSDHPQHPERQDDRKGGARGFDTAKKVKGRKPHIVVDSLGFLLGVLVHTTALQDADSAGTLMTRVKRLYCWLPPLFRGFLLDHRYIRLIALPPIT